MRNIIACFAILMLAACASGPPYGEKLAGWKGASEKEVVTTWGVPDKTYAPDRNTKMLAYVTRRNVSYPGSFSTCFATRGGVGYAGNCFGGYPTTTETWYCETTFVLTNGRVTNTGYKGNGCR